MANVLRDAKVGFLTGSQSSIDTMLSQGANAGAKHGYFYLTKVFITLLSVNLLLKD